MSDYKIETKCIQSGYKPGNGEPRVLPIYQSTTFKYNSSDQMGRLFDLEESGYFYTRLQNPTNDAVAAKICDLEGGVAAMLTSSGQAANFYAIMNIVEAGDHIVCASALYGGTYNLYAHTIKKMGVEATFVEPDCSEEDLNAAFRDNTKVVFGESIANPALVVLDFEKFAKAAHAHGVPFIVDIRDLLEKSGVEPEKLEHFDTVYKEAAGEDTSILVPAITGTGKFAVKTPDVDIKVNPDRLDLVETRFIEGRRCLVIAVENNVEVNGMPVKMWEEAQN